MKIYRSVFSLAAFAALAASALGMGSAAQARDLSWSIGVASPGVQIGVSNAPQVVYRQPVYVPQAVYYDQPQVVYGQSQVFYGQPQVFYGQPQVVHAPQPYYVRSDWAPPGYRHGWGPRHFRHNDRWDNDRWDRGDRRRFLDGGGHGYR